MRTARRSYAFLVSGIAAGAILWALCSQLDLPVAACWCAFTAGVCAVWWVTEALPLPATGLVPFVVFPLFGVIDYKQVAHGYGHRAILLLMGGFLLSAGMERSGVHRRIALGLVNLVGGSSAPRLIAGFMLATGLLSMWVSNTATTLMMLPIALAVLQQAEPGKTSSALRTALLLGIAYSASVGGMATPVGTPPNVLFLAEYERQTGASIGFMDWIRVALPMVFLLLPATWFALTRGLKLDQPIRMPEVGNWRPCERRVLCVFLVTAFAWVFRTAPFGGWVQLIGAVDAEGAPTVGDSTVALASALALFLIPSGGNAEATTANQSDTSKNLAPAEGSATAADEHGSRFEALLDWETAVRIPWGILLLFGGGLVLADGFQTTGLSDRIGQTLAGLNGLPPLVIVLAVCLLVNFLTELTSSTATTALLLPILAETARAAQLPLEMIMIPGTISASCAFMLPVATAPNTIVFGSGGLTTLSMAKRGWKLNLLSAMIISLIGWALLRG